jgi:Protein of unknown function (DUF3530)
MGPANSRTVRRDGQPILLPMKATAPIRRQLLLCTLCTAAGGVLAASPPSDPKAVPTAAAGAAAAPAPATGTAPATATAPAPATTPAAGDADLAALAARLADERRMLKAGGGEFAVFVRTAQEEPARGTLLLIPGDGAHPASAAAVAQIHATLPAHGWSSWLLSLESPPRSWTATIGAAAAPAPPAGAAANQPRLPDASLDAERAQELQFWAERCQARIAAAIAAAAAAGGKVVLLSEGSAALLLSRAVAAAPATIQGAVQIEPIELGGPVQQWPEGLAAPVLDVMSPAASRAQGAARRERARERGLRNYRQLTLETGSWYAARGETMLARRLRGWLSALDGSLNGGRGAD